MQTCKLEELTIARAARQLESKQISPLELTQLYLERIRRLNPLLNAYVTVVEQQALAEARQAEAEINRGQYRAHHDVPEAVGPADPARGLRPIAGWSCEIALVHD